MKKFTLFGLFFIALTFGTIAHASALEANAVPASRYYGRFIVSRQASDTGAWYISPIDKRRYYFKDEFDGYEKIQSMVLGITNDELFKIPLPSETFVGDMALRHRLSGCFLLQVENLGRMWYVQPVDLKRYYIENPKSLRYLFDLSGVNVSDQTLSSFNVGTDADLDSFSPGTNTLINCNIKLDNQVTAATVSSNTVYHNTTYNNVTVATTNQPQGCAYGTIDCGENYHCVNNACVPLQGCAYNNPICPMGYLCQNNTCQPNPNAGCATGTFMCDDAHVCQNNVCILRQGCAYGNPGCGSGFHCENNACIYNWYYNGNQPQGCAYGTYSCGVGFSCINNTCTQNQYQNQFQGCAYGTVSCGLGFSCQNNTCVQNQTQPLAGCAYGNPACDAAHDCVNNVCMLKTGCAFNNPVCGLGFTCQNNTCVQSLPSGCAFANPVCPNNYGCVNNTCLPLPGCAYNNPICDPGYTCQNNSCVSTDGLIKKFSPVVPLQQNENRLRAILLQP